MTSYSSDYPSLEVDPSIKTFFEQFYEISDNPDAHEKYVQQYSKDATLILATRKCHGHNEILALRHSMWEKVASRKHNPIKVFPFGPNADQVMLYGTVHYELKDGRKVAVDWAARAHLIKEEGTMKMDFYQVYLDTAATSPPPSK